MKKYPSFKIDFLGCEVCLILDKDWLKICGNILNRDLTKDKSLCTANAIAFAKDKTYYIAAPKSVKNRTVYHECFHVLMEITDDFDLELDRNNQEVQAYLLEYIIDETIKIKKRKKK